MNNISVSKRESEIMNKIKEHEQIIFTAKDVQRFLHISKRNAYQLFQRMKEKKNYRNHRTRKIHVERTLGFFEYL